MHVDVKDGLTGPGAIIEDHPEGVTDTFLSGEISADTHHFADQFFILRAYRSRALEVFLGDDQKMGGGLGADVPEGKDIIILVKLVRRNITIDNLAKQAVVHGKPR